MAPAGPAADDAFYQPGGSGPDGHRYLSTPLTAGPWDPSAQPAGPPIALVATAIERDHARGDARVVRVTADIPGPVPVAPVTMTTTLTRPGRGAELLTGSLSAQGRQVLAVHAWRIRILPGSHPAPQIPDGPPPPTPDSGHHDPYLARTRHGYLAAMEWRFLTGAFNQPGPARGCACVTRSSPLKTPPHWPACWSPPTPATASAAPCPSPAGASAPGHKLGRDLDGHVKDTQPLVSQTAGQPAGLHKILRQVIVTPPLPSGPIVQAPRVGQ